MWRAPLSEKCVMSAISVSTFDASNINLGLCLVDVCVCVLANVCSLQTDDELQRQYKRCSCFVYIITCYSRIKPPPPPPSPPSSLPWGAHSIYSFRNFRLLIYIELGVSAWTVVCFVREIEKWRIELWTVLMISLDIQICLDSIFSAVFLSLDIQTIF